MPIRVYKFNWVIITVRKHIRTDHARTGIGYRVRIHESRQQRRIVSRTEIVITVFAVKRRIHIAPVRYRRKRKRN